MEYTYKSHIHPYSKKFVLVKIDESDLINIDEFVRAVIQAKQQESHHQKDNRSAYKRFFTGTLGEVALEKFLGVKGIVDWTVGDSKKFHTPDLQNIGINAGIKTVNYGLFPIIFKKSSSPQIINIAWKNKYVYICGLATIDVLNHHQADDLIRDERLRKRGTKTAFVGFEHLRQFDNMDSLLALI